MPVHDSLNSSYMALWRENDKRAKSVASQSCPSVFDVHSRLCNTVACPPFSCMTALRDHSEAQFIWRLPEMLHSGNSWVKSMPCLVRLVFAALDDFESGYSIETQLERLFYLLSYIVVLYFWENILGFPQYITRHSRWCSMMSRTVNKNRNSAYKRTQVRRSLEFEFVLSTLTVYDTISGQIRKIQHVFNNSLGSSS